MKSKRPGVKNSKLLLLGSTGKMGTALKEVFRRSYDLIGKNSQDFDAVDFKQVARLINDHKPDIVINAVALLGIDPCEKEPERALRLNTLYPKFLAERSKDSGFLLIHFSTDAVFSDKQDGFCKEGDSPRPLNIYGLTKYGGDCFVQNIAKKYYIFRLPVLFGETAKETQFVEKMLKKIRQGEKSLRISADIISSPTYSKDAAREVKRIIERKCAYGLYHICNAGKASLYDLIKEIIRNLDLDVVVKKCSHRDFPCVGVKNTCTPLKSQKSGPLRPWKEAVKEYCSHVKEFTRKG
jgi:dTDP-4-dehydrorhamnose reductase